MNQESPIINPFREPVEETNAIVNPFRKPVGKTNAIVNPFKKGNVFVGQPPSEIIDAEMPKAGSYTQDDIVENDKMFSVVESFMEDRYGLQSIRNKTRTSIVDSFLNNRRGVSAGNSIRSLSEMDYLNDISGNEDKLARAGAAYELFDNMANIFSSETSFAEKAEGVMDYTRTAIFDPVNLVGGLLGRVAAGGTVRAATSVGKKLALQELQKQTGKKVVGKKAKKEMSDRVKKQFMTGLNEATKVNKAEIAKYTSEILGTSGLKRLATKKAFVELGVVAAVDTAASVGMEVLYQQGLMKTGVREDFDKFAIGVAFVGGLVVLPGIQAVSILKRGKTGPGIIPTELTEPDAKGFMSTVSESVSKYSEGTPVKRGSDWSVKVEKGIDLEEDLSSDFFLTLLLGHQAENGDVILKGMAQSAFENGYSWSKRFEEDKFTDWMGDVIAQTKPKEIKGFLNSIEEATGNKILNKDQFLKGKKGAEKLGQVLATRMSRAGKNLNAVSQAAKMLGISTEDVNIKELIETALDQGLLARNFRTAEKFNENIAVSWTRAAQSKIVRLLVSNPSTSALNVVGWGSNVALGTTSDMALAAVHLTVGGAKRLIGAADAGKNNFYKADILLNSSSMRLKLLLDPDTTYAAYMSALQRNSKSLQRLTSILPGGVDKASNLVTDSKFKPTTKLNELKLDNTIDIIQTLSLVSAQDAYTKSQEFVFQMNKQLKIATGKGWNDFYTSDSAKKFMATKEYRQLEANAVELTSEAIFSKSYKNKGALGQIAGMIEDARNIPGLGMLIPFGRFYNSTIAFAGKNTPGVNLIAKRAGYFEGSTYGDLYARSAVVGGAIYAMAQDETEKRKQGIGLYETVDYTTGEIINQQYDYPISLFKAAARGFSYLMEGEPIPKEITARIAKDFGINSQLRNLNKSQRDMTDIIYYMFDSENRDLLKAAAITGSAVLSQPISAVTRPLEPLNIVAGIIRGEDNQPIDRYQGSKFKNNALRYVDNIAALLIGESLEEPQQQAASGITDTNTTKVFGVRSVRLTNTQNVMRLIGLDDYSLNEATNKRRMAPKAINEYHKIFHDVIEARSKAIMEAGPDFSDMSLEEQRSVWKKAVSASAKDAKLLMRLKGQDQAGWLESYKADYQHAILSSYSQKNINKALKELEYKKDFEDLERGQLLVLDSYLETRDLMIELDIPESVRAIP